MILKTRGICLIRQTRLISGKKNFKHCVFTYPFIWKLLSENGTFCIVSS